MSHIDQKIIFMEENGLELQNDKNVSFQDLCRIIQVQHSTIKKLTNEVSKIIFEIFLLKIFNPMPFCLNKI